MFEAARSLDYFANLRAYSPWVRLGLRTETQADVLLALTGIGREYRGLIGAVLLFFRRAEVEGTDKRPGPVEVASDGLFQIKNKEEEESVLDRFGR